MNRLLGIAFLLLFGCTASNNLLDAPILHQGTDSYLLPSQKPFYHGVASGDPAHDAVTIWTRLTPDSNQRSIELSWQVSLDYDFQSIIASGTTQADKTNDYTAKVRVKGLNEYQSYFYRFGHESNYSSIGRTKTAPSSSVPELKFAIVSCTNFEAGYYNALARIAEIDDLDAVIHLGDYIYEYGVDLYGDKTLDR